MKGKFIVIDGMDGSGKGTQIGKLKERFEGRGITFTFTREPGGTPKAEEIREILLSAKGPQSNAICDFFLFWAARGSHIEDVVEPARKQGRHVICDRYDSSTYAFQLYGEQSPSWLWNMFDEVRLALPAEKYEPDAYIVLDLPPSMAFERLKKDAKNKQTKFDVKPLAFHKRVRKGLNMFSQRYGTVHLVDASRSPKQVHEDVWKIVSEILEP